MHGALAGTLAGSSGVWGAGSAQGCRESASGSGWFWWVSRIGCAFGVGFWQPSVCAVGALVVVGTVMGWSNQDEFRVSVDALRELSVS